MKFQRGLRCIILCLQCLRMITCIMVVYDIVWKVMVWYDVLVLPDDLILLTWYTFMISFLLSDIVLYHTNSSYIMFTFVSCGVALCFRVLHYAVLCYLLFYVFVTPYNIALILRSCTRLHYAGSRARAEKNRSCSAYYPYRGIHHLNQICMSNLWCKM